ncbi:permease [Maritimibacter dapengensis]|uniref:Permease n=1 Tax=Maritimibacter dapengensis TaxID=2836868 RepID=A0ABS6T7E5_9RHOB|nr:permease [Maritimibacter dapengensis]MBV7380411.1 permease [Maritimibacter dapengensis]
MTDSTALGITTIGTFARHLRSPWTISALCLAAVAVFDTTAFLPVSLEALGSFVHTLPFILIAVALVAYLKASGAEALIGRAFEGREVPAILLAATFGALAPFCSCEVIPFIAGLIALGAPIAAIMAFWLASPLIDPGSLVVTAGALDWSFAVGKAVSAVGLGLFGGFVTMAISRAGGLKDVAKPRSVRAAASSWSTSSCCAPSSVDDEAYWPIWKDADRLATFRTEGWDNLLFLVKWLAFAYVLQALLVRYLPADWIASTVGGEGIGPIALSALVGMPAYLNSYAAPPLLSGLMEQGMSAGSAMAFMVAGAVSCVPAMAAIWALVKTHVFLLYLALGMVGAVLAGLAFQAFV